MVIKRAGRRIVDLPLTFPFLHPVDPVNPVHPNSRNGQVSFGPITSQLIRGMFKSAATNPGCAATLMGSVVLPLRGRGSFRTDYPQY